jgi:hypothetical protein
VFAARVLYCDSKTRRTVLLAARAAGSAAAAGREVAVAGLLEGGAEQPPRDASSKAPLLHLGRNAAELSFSLPGLTKVSEVIERVH